MTPDNSKLCLRLLWEQGSAANRERRLCVPRSPSDFVASTGLIRCAKAGLVGDFGLMRIWMSAGTENQSRAQGLHTAGQ